MPDNMAYKFQPAGHEMPEDKRKYTEPNKKLQEAFKWALETLQKREGSLLYSEFDKFTQALKRKLGNKNFAIPEINSLLLQYEGRTNLRKSGTFLSAMYNIAKEKVIVFDVKIGTPVSKLGMRLPKNKTLIIKAPCEDRLGESANGDIILYASCSPDEPHAHLMKGNFLNYGVQERGTKDFYGMYINSGETGPIGEDDDSSLCPLVLNFGKTQNIGAGTGDEAVLINTGECDELGKKSTGVIIAIKNPKTMHSGDARLCLNEKACNEMPELKKYIESLRKKVEEGRKDYHKAAHFLRSNTRDKIQSRLEQILREAGHTW